MANFRYSMILEIVDRASAPARKFKRAFTQMRRDFHSVGTEADRSGRSLDHWDRRAQRLGQGLRGRGLQMISSSLAAIGRNAARSARSIFTMERALKLAKAAAGRGLSTAASMVKWGAAGAVGAGGFALFDMFKKAGQFEQYQVMLEGVEGSAKKARKSMDWVQDFAQKTPYELDQVMEAFVQLKAYGVDPMDGTLQSLGDGASGMSKELMASVEMLADAMTGEYERLKEFGIRASKQGDKVVFSYRKNGKDLRKEAKFTAENVRLALVGIFNERFGGGMERQSKTMFGLISNLKDQWSRFELMVADAGIFDMVKAKIGEWLDKVNQLAANGSLKAWAKDISHWLEEAFKWAVDFVETGKWKAVLDDLKGIAEAAKIVADVVLTIAQNWDRVSLAVRLANPASSSGAIREMIERARGSGPAPSIPYKPLSAFRPTLPTPGLARPFGIAKPGARTSSWQLSPAAGKGLMAPRQAAQVGGKVTVEVKAAPGTTARVASVSSSNRAVPVQAKVGNVMRGAA